MDVGLDVIGAARSRRGGGLDQQRPFQLSFNTSLKVDFQGSQATSDGGLVLGGVQGRRAVVRWMPKDWIYRIVRGFDGFCLLFNWQLFPLGQEELVSRIRIELGLPVDCPRLITEGTIQRLLRWHAPARAKKTESKK
jgi:hypothetical protein